MKLCSCILLGRVNKGMSTVYFTSDLHLGHKNIYKFRPEFVSEDQHYNYLKDVWHSCINKHDKVFILGDCAFTIDRLNQFDKWVGHKVLVMGNHCYPAKGISLDDLNRVFKGDVYSLYKHKEFWLSHAPIHPDELRGKCNIHGHTHCHRIKDEKYINVCPENTLDFAPVSIDEIRQFANNKQHHKFKYTLGE